MENSEFALTQRTTIKPTTPLQNIQLRENQPQIFRGKNYVPSFGLLLWTRNQAVSWPSTVSLESTNFWNNHSVSTSTKMFSSSTQTGYSKTAQAQLASPLALVSIWQENSLHLCSMLAVKAIGEIEDPRNAKQYQKFLVIATYMAPFIPQLSQQTVPLKKLLKKMQTSWGPSPTKQHHKN